MSLVPKFQAAGTDLHWVGRCRSHGLGAGVRGGSILRTCRLPHAAGMWVTVPPSLAPPGLLFRIK